MTKTQNELQAIQLAIKNTLKSFKWNSNNRTGYRKNVVIDLPLSQSAFSKYFVQNIPKLSTVGTNKSVDLSVQYLK